MLGGRRVGGRRVLERSQPELEVVINGHVPDSCWEDAARLGARTTAAKDTDPDLGMPGGHADPDSDRLPEDWGRSWDDGTFVGGLGEPAREAVEKRR